MIYILANSSQSNDGKCLTLNGKPCSFPFIINGISRNVCLPLPSGGSWCSINTDENSNHIAGDENWELCGPSCPVLPSLHKPYSAEEVNSGIKTNSKFYLFPFYHKS